MDKNTYKEPVYLISAVAQILKIHPQTLRQYEREGLIKPSRSNGKIRLYSQNDIDNIKTILQLTRDLGINLAGVDVILNLKAKLELVENELKISKAKLAKFEKLGIEPLSKALVLRNSSELIVIEEI